MREIVEAIAASIMWSERGALEPTVDWPADIADAHAITETVLRAFMNEPSRDLGNLRSWPADDRIDCECGRSFGFYFNGGELDWRRCECGRDYKGYYGRNLVEVTGP